MSTVYLNGDYLPMQEARISPMDRGFLFGDGIYEVIPSYDGRLVGFAPHLARMQRGLDALEIDLQLDHSSWRLIAQELLERNGGGSRALYIHVSRGADTTRQHSYPSDISPTVFCCTYAIAEPPSADRDSAKTYRVSTAEDLRWKRCDIKTTALLGNVLHYQQSHERGDDEVILYNSRGEITEAAACNVYAIKAGVVITPALDHQKLPGITRELLLTILRTDGSIPVEERVLTLDELRAADEVWLTSSSKDIAPVTQVDGKQVGDGRPGDVWVAAQALYSQQKFDF